MSEFASLLHYLLSCLLLACRSFPNGITGAKQLTGDDEIAYMQYLPYVIGKSDKVSCCGRVIPRRSRTTTPLAVVCCRSFGTPS